MTERRAPNKIRSVKVPRRGPAGQLCPLIKGVADSLYPSHSIHQKSHTRRVPLDASGCECGERADDCPRWPYFTNMIF